MTKKSIITLFLALAALVMAGGAGTPCARAENAKMPRAKLTVVADPKEAGRTEGSGEYAMGAVVEIQAFAREGYVFSRWQGAVVNPTDPITRAYAGSEMQQITAVFEPIGFLLTAGVVPAGAGFVDGAGYRPGGIAPLISARPAPGYAFDKWEGPVAVPDEASTALKAPISKPTSVTAHFKPAITMITVTVAASPSGGGAVAGGGQYKKGSIIKVRAVPGNGYLFDGWEGPVVSPGFPETAVAVQKDAHLTARFIPDKSLVRCPVSPAGAGRVTGDLGAQPVGIAAKIKAEAAPGFRFVRWDGPVAEPKNASTTITPKSGQIARATAVFECAR